MLHKILTTGVIVAGTTLAVAPTASAGTESFLTSPAASDTLLTGPAGAAALGGGLVGGIVDKQGETLGAAVRQTAAGVPAVLPLLTKPVRAQ
ncbi:hypothetical protein LG634_01135 [Streptomyces bambusae]|uniref:hypothetical protein n=1 Tax=Streptomyces bambusae TaxID=1550616 RepID=UPI001CFC8B57|nr:hypothetical protein [Streptomyces bambusae]MCB5163457.1 hypothetical protein [Streptomyces bambusae]